MSDIIKEQERVRNALLHQSQASQATANVVKFVVEFIYNNLKKIKKDRAHMRSIFLS